MSYKKFLRMGYKKFLRIGYKKFPKMGYKKFPKMGYKKFLGMGYKKFLRIVTNIFRENNYKKITSPGLTRATVRCSSQNFSMENLSQETLEKIFNFCRHFHQIFLSKNPGNFCGFLRISGDFPQTAVI